MTWTLSSLSTATDVESTDVVSGIGVSTVQSPFAKMAALTSLFSWSAYETTGQPSERSCMSLSSPTSFDVSSTVDPENVGWNGGKR